ncbi:probable mediator of RNA polymerase II transcription subunit 19b [Leguminivora glycinivorella]|uniref:probable mediator of RNA polymerase II transcription subunit 19b n=1 Tax=Leguminivora glycinivorella TaxID=1035111 RepID=UPI00200C6F29|nr:probable mediator of RNA polymerase II transcription subunit 19b [Leguminivora glycinivorella]
MQVFRLSTHANMRQQSVWLLLIVFIVILTYVADNEVTAAPCGDYKYPHHHEKKGDKVKDKDKDKDKDKKKKKKKDKKKEIKKDIEDIMKKIFSR